MKTWFFLTINLLMGAFHCLSQNSDFLSLGPINHIQKADFHVWKPDNATAVLVITPGFGDNPQLTDLSELNEWKQFASSHNFGLICVDFTANHIQPQIKDENLNPIEGTAEIIEQGLSQEFKADLPTFFYGRNDQSTRYVLSAIDSHPDSFAAWCCNGPEFLRYWPRLVKETPPGIINCTTDSIRYDDAEKVFTIGRNAQNKWTWLSSRSVDSPKFREFIRQYFLSLLVPQTEQWRNISTRQVIDVTTANSDPDNSSWFPDAVAGAKWASLQTDRPDKPVIIEKEVDLSGHDLPNIQLYLRIPNGAQDASGVDGVLAYCTWTKERDTLVQQLSNDIDQPAEKIELPSVQMLRFAAKHNLAVLTWSTPGTWNVAENSDELTEKEKLDIDRQFELFAGAWEQGVSELCHDYKLPEDKYLLFGMSRGAQWAHRLALRNPKRFLAINVHVSGSYDTPTPEGKNCLWLITSGEFDGGLADSKKFYANCRKLGYPILFKAPNLLGHEMRSDVDALRDAFFEYALSIKNQTTNSDLDLSTLISLKTAKYVGDYVSQKVVTADKADQIKPDNQVYLPTDALAEAWQAQPPVEPMVDNPVASSEPSPITAVALVAPVNSKTDLSAITTSTNAPSTPPAPISTPIVAITVAPAVSAASKPRMATVITPTKIEAVTPSGGHASVPLDRGTKLTIISVNADGTITAVTDFNFQGQVQQACVSIDKP